MGKLDQMMNETNRKALLYVTIILAILWYFCLIIIPAFPNGACPAFGAPGSFGGSSGGGTVGGTCPVCPDCPAPDYSFEIPYCADGVKCPGGNYDTYYGTCRCGTGNFWDASLQLCCPNVVT
jgi:hypothetical protein